MAAGASAICRAGEAILARSRTGTNPVSAGATTRTETIGCTRRAVFPYFARAVTATAGNRIVDTTVNRITTIGGTRVSVVANQWRTAATHTDCARLEPVANIPIVARIRVIVNALATQRRITAVVRAEIPVVAIQRRTSGTGSRLTRLVTVAQITVRT